jgi:pimeloyl-ACP methyl ester carboxylesterase
MPTDPTQRAAALAQLDSVRARTMSWPEGRGAGARAFYDYFLTPPDQRAIPPNLNVPTAVVLSNLLSGAGPDADRAAVEAAQERYVQETQTWLRDVDPLHFVVAQYAGHFVHRDAPDLVVEAIRQVFSWAQGHP